MGFNWMVIWLTLATISNGSFPLCNLNLVNSIRGLSAVTLSHSPPAMEPAPEPPPQYPLPQSSTITSNLTGTVVPPMHPHQLSWLHCTRYRPPKLPRKSPTSLPHGNRRRIPRRRRRWSISHQPIENHLRVELDFDWCSEHGHQVSLRTSSCGLSTWLLSFCTAFAKFFLCTAPDRSQANT